MFKLTMGNVVRGCENYFVGYDVPMFKVMQGRLVAYRENIAVAI
ncbi:MAG: hypothetical protein ABSD99_12680 [Candidatus Bathyarchaeia archaeon]